jgi:hypothetical protein
VVGWDRGASEEDDETNVHSPTMSGASVRLAGSKLSSRSKSLLADLQAELGPSEPPLSPPLSPSLSPPRRSSPSLSALLPVRQPLVAAPVEGAAGGHVPTHRAATQRLVERRLVEQRDQREGGGAQTQLLEAGAHLWLAEELRSAASLLSDGCADPRIAASRLQALAAYLQEEGCTQRWADGDGAYGGGHVAKANRAASCMHRASQCRHAARAVLEYALALRHGGARGWVTVFGDGGMNACDATVVPTLLSLADSETALARSRARPHSRPGASDHAHAALAHPLSEHAAAHAHGGVRSAQRDGRPVASLAAAHCRRRLSEAGEQLSREASLVADAPTMLAPPPPEMARVAARVLAGGASAGYAWRDASNSRGGRRRRGFVSATAWGSYLHPQKGGTWLGHGWRWRGADSDDSDDCLSDDENNPELEARARVGRRAIRTAESLSRRWDPEHGTCVRCVERHVAQVPTLLAR